MWRPTRRLGVLLLAGSVLGVASAAPGPRPQERTGSAPVQAAVFVPPGGSSLAVRTLERDGRILVSVNDVVLALGGQVEMEPVTRSYEIRSGTHVAVFGIDAPIAVVDSKIVNLSFPIVGEGPEALADADFFQKVLGPLFGLSFNWDRPGRVLLARKAELPETGVEASVADYDDSTKVVFRFGQLPSFRLERGEEQVVLRITGYRLSFAATEKGVESSRVSRLLFRPGEVAVVLKEPGLGALAYTLTAPPRIVVDIQRMASPQASAAPAAQEATGGLRLPRPATPSTAPEPRTIVIDPGHGGSEEGAKGPGGALEKDLMLALGRTVRETLMKRGYRVVLTRDSDLHIALDDRAAAANAVKADLFISLHANASPTPQTRGTEVYYLSLDASDRLAAAVAEAENRAEPTATPSAESNAATRELDLILWDLAHTEHVNSSARLAEIIQASLNVLLGIPSRGVKQAPFRVLIGVDAPAVLVEVAFITNPEEEQKLQSEEFRRQIAETLGSSLDSYFSGGGVNGQR